MQEGAPGLKGYELLNWFGLFSTGGTPADMVERLNALTVKALAEPKTAETLDKPGHRRAPDNRGAVQGLRRAESRKFAGIIEKAEIKLET